MENAGGHFLVIVTLSGQWAPGPGFLVTSIGTIFYYKSSHAIIIALINFKEQCIYRLVIEKYTCGHIVSALHGIVWSFPLSNFSTRSSISSWSWCLCVVSIKTTNAPTSWHAITGWWCSIGNFFTKKCGQCVTVWGRISITCVLWYKTNEIIIGIQYWELTFSVTGSCAHWIGWLPNGVWIVVLFWSVGRRSRGLKGFQLLVSAA